MSLEFSSFSEFNDFLVQEKATFTDKYLRRLNSNKCRNDFEFIRTIGIGSFGKVYLAKEKDLDNRTYFAMKQLSKKLIVNTKQVMHTLSEKRILQSLNCSFTVKLIYFFMDNTNLYFVLPYVGGGELFRLFRNVGPFSENESKFYIAQVILAFEYLHYLDIIYRDLKPENLLIDHKGYIKVTDFGLAKLVAGRTYTLCGTPDYIAPEIILNKGYGKSVDFWSLGVLVFELNAGYPPFIAPDLMRMYETIVAAKYKTPDSFTRELKDLLRKLIQVDVSKRIGNLKNSIDDVKSHNWFKSINWLSVLNHHIEAPHIPVLSGPGDSENFDILIDVLEEEYQPLATDKYKYYFGAF